MRLVFSVLLTFIFSVGLSADVVTCQDGSKRWRGPFTPEVVTDAQLCGEQPITKTTRSIDPEFLVVFGPKPQASINGVSNVGEGKEFETYQDYRAAVVTWEQNLKQWKGTAVPPYDRATIQLAVDNLVQWGLGEPVFFQIGNRWVARFPNAELKTDYEAPAEFVVFYPQLAIALYQVASFTDEFNVDDCHPFSPPVICGE